MTQSIFGKYKPDNKPSVVLGSTLAFKNDTVQYEWAKDMPKWVITRYANRIIFVCVFLIVCFWGICFFAPVTYSQYIPPLVLTATMVLLTCVHGPFTYNHPIIWPSNVYIGPVGSGKRGQTTLQLVLVTSFFVVAALAPVAACLSYGHPSSNHFESVIFSGVLVSGSYFYFLSMSSVHETNRKEYLSDRNNFKIKQ